MRVVGFGVARFGSACICGYWSVGFGGFEHVGQRGAQHKNKTVGAKTAVNGSLVVATSRVVQAAINEALKCAKPLFSLIYKASRRAVKAGPDLPGVRGTRLTSGGAALQVCEQHSTGDRTTSASRASIRQCTAVGPTSVRDDMLFVVISGDARLC